MNYPIKSRLLPSLLDRLTDDEPDKQTESIGQQLLTEEQYRDKVKRDLEWLFNATPLESCCDLDMFNYENENKIERNELRDSVVNFGLPTLAGQSAATIKAKLAKVEANQRQALLNFEPRILPKSLRIETSSSEQFNQNALRFDIRADLHMQPSPWPQHWQLTVDMETNAVQLEIKE